MIRHLILALSVSLALASTFAADQTYLNSDRKFSLQYPEKWEKKERINGTVVTLLAPKEGGKDSFHANANVIEQELPTDTTLKSFSDSSLSVLPKLLKNFKELERKEISLGDAKAVSVTYTYTFDEYELKSTQIFTVNGKHGYTVTLAAEGTNFDAMKKTFDDIASSFKAL